MKSRKGTALALTALVTSLGYAGFSLALADDDDKSKLHKTMEMVQAKNSVIVKGVRNEANFRKSQKDVAEAAKELVKLGKDVRDETGPAKNEKKDQKAWTDLMDDFIKESDAFAEEVGKDGMKGADAKTKYRDVSKTCSACHEIFRKEE